MAEAHLILFDDEHGRFGPLTRLRAAFDVRCGVWTNRQRIETATDRSAAGLYLRPALAPVYEQRDATRWVNPPLDEAFDEQSRFLLVNGRWNPAISQNELKHKLIDLDLNQAICQRDGQLLAACLDRSQAQCVIERGHESLVHELAIETIEAQPLLDRPWQILDGLETTIAEDLRGFAREQAVAASACVHRSAVLEDKQGPVVIDEHAEIGPLAVLVGPCYIGKHSIVKPHTSIRPHTVIGEHCRVAGEIGSSIIDDRSNKAHDGYLGHGLVGRWVNLGAQTTASNLKNTYGSVRLRLPADSIHDPQPPPAEDTGRRFHGPVIGDLVRTAIGTRLPTGAVIDLGAMLALSAFAPTYVKPLAFITDKAEHTHEMDKFIQTARIMMGRRGDELQDALETLLRSFDD